MNLEGLTTPGKNPHNDGNVSKGHRRQVKEPIAKAGKI